MKAVLVSIFAVALVACQNGSHGGSAEGSDPSASGANKIDLEGTFQSGGNNHGGAVKFRHAIAKRVNKDEVYFGELVTADALAIVFSTDPVNCKLDLTDFGGGHGRAAESYRIYFLFREVDNPDGRPNYVPVANNFAFQYAFQRAGNWDYESLISSCPMQGPCVSLDGYGRGARKINATVNMDWALGTDTLNLHGHVDLRICK